MSDITTVMYDIYLFAKDTFWEFNMFGQHWSMSFLQIWLLPVIAGLTISIVKHIIEIANM